MSRHPETPLLGGPDPLDNPMHPETGVGIPRMHVNDDGTHSISIVSHPKNHALAKQLLRAVDHRGDAVLVFDQTRPLIDVIQQAVLQEWPGFGKIRNWRDFTDTLRKAHRFYLDDTTSAMIADLSLAVAADLEGARRMAIPPFPTTWIDFNNKARLDRMEQHGVPLTPMAAGQTDGPPVDRVGWLIQPTNINDGYCATYFTCVDAGPVMAPLAWYWSTNDTVDPEFNTIKQNHVRGLQVLERLSFGMKDSGVLIGSYTLAYPPMHPKYGGPTMQITDDVWTLMKELSGELRHIWGFLVAMAAGHAGLTVSSRPRPRPEGPDPKQPNGKPLFALEHHDLTLHLGKKQQLGKIILQAITHHRKRHHEVRAHMRRLHSGRLVPVRSHERGDKALGEVTKTYKVEK